MFGGSAAKGSAPNPRLFTGSTSSDSRTPPVAAQDGGSVGHNGPVPWSPLPTPGGDSGPGPSPLADLLDGVLAGLGGPSVDTVVLIHDRWSELVGVEVAAHVQPVSIEDGCLRVVTDGPAWASHLKWAEAEIVTRIESLVGPGQVTAMSVRVGRR